MLRSTSVTRTPSRPASRRAQPTPAKPPPTTTTPSSSDMRGLLSRGARAETLEQVVADAQRVGHRRQRRVHRADAREEARVDDVEVVDLVRAAVGVQDRGGGVAAEAARPGLVGYAGHRDLVLEIGVVAQQVVV